MGGLDGRKWGCDGGAVWGWGLGPDGGTIGMSALAFIIKGTFTKCWMVLAQVTGTNRLTVVVP